MPIRPVSNASMLVPSSAALRAASLLDAANAEKLLNQTDTRLMPNGLTFEQDRIFKAAHGAEKEHPAPRTKPSHPFQVILDYDLLLRLDAFIEERRYAERKRSASSRRKVIEEALEAFLDQHEAAQAS